MYVLIAGHSNTYVYLLLSNIIIIGPLILISPPATQISGPGLREPLGTSIMCRGPAALAVAAMAPVMQWDQIRESRPRRRR